MKSLVMFLMFIAIGLSACSNKNAQDDEAANGPPSKLTIYAVNYPLAYFAERIGGAQVNVVFSVPSDVDPAFWKPSPEAIAEFQQADLILQNGAGYAKWVPLASLPENRVVNTSASVSDRYIQNPDHVSHSHGPAGDHAHGGIAFTTWLDFSLARAQAAAIRDGIARTAADTSGLSARFASLDHDLAVIDVRMHEISEALRDRLLLASHPVYQYLGARYELAIRSVEWEPDIEPTSQQWRQLEELRAGQSVAIMLWESEPLPTVATRLRDSGIEPVVFDPCARRSSPDADFINVMQQNIERIAAALR